MSITRTSLLAIVVLHGCSRSQIEQVAPPPGEECVAYRYQGWVYGQNVNAVYAPSWDVGEVGPVVVRLRTILESGETLELATAGEPTSTRRAGGSISMIERLSTSNVVCGPGGVSRRCRIEGGHWPNADSVALAAVSAAWRVRVLAPDGGVLLERPAEP